MLESTVLMYTDFTAAPSIDSLWLRVGKSAGVRNKSDKEDGDCGRRGSAYSFGMILFHSLPES
jgi:hypothetical protein